MSKLAKATTCDFDGCVGCYLYQLATPSHKEAKKNGERAPRSERIRKRILNNQLDAAESVDDDGDSAFADPDHVEEDKEEEDTETVVVKTVTPLVE